MCSQKQMKLGDCVAQEHALNSKLNYEIEQFPLWQIKFKKLCKTKNVLATANKIMKTLHAHNSKWNYEEITREHVQISK